MEKESNGEMTPSRFRQELNEWFEERGIVDNLRSHLRSLMIAALQRTEISLKSHQKTCPKIQCIDLMVAEYLLKHGCHYSLSILTSELPSLANFGNGPVFIRGSKYKTEPEHLFQENEVLEILNCLRLFCDNPRYVWRCYNEKKGEESLLECLLRLLTSSLRFEGNSKDARDDEESFRKRAGDLAEREKRIQEYLKSHQEELLKRLKIAEKDLDDRRETIDKELTERQMDLRRIAFHWKDKHKEIMSLSKLFTTVKDENKSLREKLDYAQEEINKLKKEIKVKTEALECVKYENLKFKTKMEEYFKWKNKSLEDESNSNVCPNMTIFNCKSSPEILEYITEANNLNPEENSSSSEILSFTEDNLLEVVRARVRILEEETGRINEKYLTSKKKYEDDLSFENEITDVLENLCSKISDVPKEDNKQLPNKKLYENSVIITTRTTTTTTEEPSFERDERDERESFNKKKPLTEKKEEEKLLPTKRQEKNREYYLESRNLLQILEKNTGVGTYPSISSSETSLHYSCSSESLNMVKADVVKPVKESEDIQPLHEDINVLECLNLLKEATYPNQHITNNTREIEVLMGVSKEREIIGGRNFGTNQI